MIQLSNEPVDYWRDVIRAVGLSRDMMDFRKKQFETFVRRYGLSGKRGLEIGCGDGAFLSLLADTEMSVFGIEHSPENVRVCREKGLNVCEASMRRGLTLSDGPFDAFCVFSYLEHVPALREFLAGIRENMRDGAVGLIEVPNFDMILEERLFAEFIVDHLFYFTTATLTRTLENNGFDVLSCRPVWQKYILSAEVRKRPVLDMSLFRNEKEKMLTRFQEFLARYRRVALWGAGHQSFTLLAMLGEMSRTIAYIVDSAPFKQGRFSPVTHIPVTAPGALLDDPVDALLVVGGSYSREIAIIAHERYRQKNIVVFHANRLDSFPPENA